MNQTQLALNRHSLYPLSLPQLLTEYRIQGVIYLPLFRSSLYEIVSPSVSLPVGAVLQEPARVDQKRAS